MLFVGQRFTRSSIMFGRRQPLLTTLRRQTLSSSSNNPSTTKQVTRPKKKKKKHRAIKTLNTKRLWTLREQKLAFSRYNLRKKNSWMETADDLLSKAASRLSWAQTKLLQQWNPRFHDRLQRKKNSQLSRINAKWWFWQMVVCVSPCVAISLYMELRGKYQMYDAYCERTRIQMQTIMGEEWANKYADYVLDQELPLTFFERGEQILGELTLLYRGLVLGDFPEDDQDLQHALQLTDAPKSLQPSLKELLESHETDQDEVALMKGLVAKVEDLEQKVENPTFLTQRASQVLQSDIGHRMEAKMVAGWLEIAEKMPPGYQRKEHLTLWESLCRTVETVRHFLENQYRSLILEELSAGEEGPVLVPPVVSTDGGQHPRPPSNEEVHNAGDAARNDSVDNGNDIQTSDKGTNSQWWRKFWK